MNTISRHPRRLAAHYLYVRRSLLKNPILSLAADGTVTAIEVCDDPDSREGVEFYSGILIPPTTNAHCHLELSHLKGRIAGGGGFAAFAKAMGDVRDGFSMVDRLAAASAADAKMWHDGVGIVGDVCNGSSTFGIKSASGIRYHNFIELFGLRSDTLDPLRPAALAAAEAGLSYSSTPHSLYSLNRKGYAAAVEGFGAAAVGSGAATAKRFEATIVGSGMAAVEGFGAAAADNDPDNTGATIEADSDADVGRVAESYASKPRIISEAEHTDAGQATQSGATIPPLSIHFMESASETELFQGRGQMAQWYESRGMQTDFGGYGSPVERLVAQTPPQRDVMLIHNCFVTDEVVDRVMAHFTGRVTWVLCPRSNRFISGIEPPYQLLRRKGVRIALGTDSLASNRSLDMVAEMRMFNGVPLEELLGWAVENGADALGGALGTNGSVGGSGGFEVGGKSGAVLLTGIDWHTMSLTADSKTVRLA